MSLLPGPPLAIVQSLRISCSSNNISIGLDSPKRDLISFTVVSSVLLIFFLLLASVFPSVWVWVWVCLGNRVGKVGCDPGLLGVLEHDPCNRQITV